jgi:dATP pyrophosphohydrolase
MGRAPFQVLVFPYRKVGGVYEFALFKRADGAYWQGVAGGGIDEETPIEAAARETVEETGVLAGPVLLQLDTVSSIPVTCFEESHLWGATTYVIPQHSFGARLGGGKIRLSPEHSEFGWFTFEQAMGKLKYEGDRTALWELNERLHKAESRGSTDVRC